MPLLFPYNKVVFSRSEIQISYRHLPIEVLSKNTFFLTVRRCMRVSACPSLIRVRSISPILLEDGITDSMCLYTMFGSL